MELIKYSHMGGQKGSRESRVLEKKFSDSIFCESAGLSWEWALQMITLHNSVQLSNPFNLELVRDCEGTLEK